MHIIWGSCRNHVVLGFGVLFAIRVPVLSWDCVGSGSVSKAGSLKDASVALAGLGLGPSEVPSGLFEGSWFQVG